MNVDLGIRWMKILILVGFSDIRYDINIFELKWVKRLILLGFIGFFYLGGFNIKCHKVLIFLMILKISVGV